MTAIQQPSNDNRIGRRPRRCRQSETIDAWRHRPDSERPEADTAAMAERIERLSRHWPRQEHAA